MPQSRDTACLRESGSVLSKSDYLMSKNNRANPTHNHRRARDHNPITTSSGGEHNQPCTTCNGSNPKPEGKHWLEYAIFGFVVATTVATSFAAYYTRGERDVMTDQEQRQLRAYVSADTGVWRWIPNPRFGQQLILFAHGETPAKQITVRGIIKILPKYTTDLSDADADDKIVSSGIALFPGETPPPNGWIETTDPVSPDQFTQITTEASSQRAYAYGIITYYDVFDVERHTQFCWWLDPLGILRDKSNNITSLRWADCPSHTDFD